MIRILSVLGILVLLSACADPTRDLSQPVEPMGDFKLGFSEVVAPNLQKLLVSRDATAEELTTQLDAAMEQRFGRFEGSKYYHLGISIEGYSLPPPVVPGKTYLAFRVTVWDDSTQSRLNAEPKLFTNAQIFESRIASSREESLKRLMETSAKLVEDWLREMQAEEGWFTTPGEAAAAETAATGAPATAG